jgi:hypothetical protein
MTLADLDHRCHGGGVCRAFDDVAKSGDLRVRGDLVCRSCGARLPRVEADGAAAERFPIAACRVECDKLSQSLVLVVLDASVVECLHDWGELRLLFPCVGQLQDCCTRRVARVNLGVRSRAIVVLVLSGATLEICVRLITASELRYGDGQIAIFFAGLAELPPCQREGLPYGPCRAIRLSGGRDAGFGFAIRLAWLLYGGRLGFGIILRSRTTGDQQQHRGKGDGQIADGHIAGLRRCVVGRNPATSRTEGPVSQLRWLSGRCAHDG